MRRRALERVFRSRPSRSRELLRGTRGSPRCLAAAAQLPASPAVVVVVLPGAAVLRINARSSTRSRVRRGGGDGAGAALFARGPRRGARSSAAARAASTAASGDRLWPQVLFAQQLRLCAFWSGRALGAPSARAIRSSTASAPSWLCVFCCKLPTDPRRCVPSSPAPAADPGHVGATREGRVGPLRDGCGHGWKCGSQLGNAAAIAAIARPHHGPNADRILRAVERPARAEAAVPPSLGLPAVRVARAKTRTMAQGHRDALAVARGSAWDHGYRLGMRMAEEARNPLPPKRALKPSTRKLLAAFPPAAEEVDLRKELDGLSDAALWEGACALAEDAARADQRRAMESGEAQYPPGGAVADWCQQFLGHVGQYQAGVRLDVPETGDARQVRDPGWLEGVAAGTAKGIIFGVRRLADRRGPIFHFFNG